MKLVYTLGLGPSAVRRESSSLSAPTISDKYMGEIIQGNFGKNKKEEEVFSDRKVTLIEIGAERIKLFAQILNSLSGFNRETEATALEQLKDLSEEELLNTITIPSDLGIKAKPTFYITAFEVLKTKIISRVKSEKSN